MARLRIDDMKPLAVLRVNVGLSRKEAAKVLNIGENTLARYELGKVDLSFGIGERMTVLYCVSFETIRQAVKKTKEIFGKIPQEKRGAVMPLFIFGLVLADKLLVVP